MVSLLSAIIFLMFGSYCLPFVFRCRLSRFNTRRSFNLEAVDSNIVIAEQILNGSFNSQKGFNPLPAYGRIRSPERYVEEMQGTFIIDRPNVTMTNKFLSIDLASIQKQIYDGATYEGRLKPLLAIVRGTGGGKTRLLEEIRKQFLMAKDTLPIAITFNSCWTHMYSKSLPGVNDTQKLVYEISYRILTSFYDIPAYSPNTQEIFNDFFNQFILSDDPKYILLGVIRHCILKTRTELGKPIVYFALMIDESIRPIETLKLQYDDPYDIIRQAVLDNVAVDGVTNILLMSSLMPSVTGKTPVSTRKIIPLKLPPILSSLEIVEQWWLKNYDSSLFADRDKFTITVMAGLVARLPRLTEMAGFILRKDIDAHIAMHDSSIPFSVNRTYVVSWLERIVVDWCGMYHFVGDFPSPQKILALVFQKKIALDNETLDLIKYSVFTNSLSKFGEGSTLIPESSFLALYAAAISSGDSHGSIQRLLKRAFTTAIEVLTREKFEEGDLLEAMGSEWLELRLQTLMNCDIDTIPITDLLGIKDDGKWFSSTFNLPSMVFKRQTRYGLKVPDPKNRAAFVTYFNKLSLPDETAMIVTPSKKSPYDLLLLYRDKDKTPHFVFIDYKSKREDAREIQQSDYTDKDVDQSRKLYGMIEDMSKLNITMSPLTKSLIGGNFTYIYMSTKKSRELIHYPKYPSSPYIVESIKTAITYFEDTEKFFGIVYDLYRPLRSAYLKNGKK